MKSTPLDWWKLIVTFLPPHFGKNFNPFKSLILERAFRGWSWEMTWKRQAMKRPKAWYNWQVMWRPKDRKKWQVMSLMTTNPFSRVIDVMSGEGLVTHTLSLGRPHLFSEWRSWWSLITRRTWWSLRGAARSGNGSVALFDFVNSQHRQGYSLHQRHPWITVVLNLESEKISFWELAPELVQMWGNRVTGCRLTAGCGNT